MLKRESGDTTMEMFLYSHKQAFLVHPPGSSNSFANNYKDVLLNLKSKVSYTDSNEKA